MTTTTTFEDLEVWRLARLLSQSIYPLTFIGPIKSNYKLRCQMHGSAGSTMTNISEGFERTSQFEFINSLSI